MPKYVEFAIAFTPSTPIILISRFNIVIFERCGSVVAINLILSALREDFVKFNVVRFDNDECERM